MKRSVIAVSLLAISAVFYAVFSAAPAFAVYIQGPFVQGTGSGGRCNPGYSRGQYQGRNVCLKCNPGYSYTRYQGREVCIKCNPGYRYTIHQGREVCVK